MQKFRILLCRMTLVLCIVSVGTYLATHSIRATLVASLISAILLQIGYFGAVLFLFWLAPEEKPVPDRRNRLHSLRVIEGGVSVSSKVADFGLDEHRLDRFPSIASTRSASSLPSGAPSEAGGGRCESADRLRPGCLLVGKRVNGLLINGGRAPIIKTQSIQ